MSHHDRVVTSRRREGGDESIVNRSAGADRDSRRSRIQRNALYCAAQNRPVWDANSDNAVAIFQAFRGESLRGISIDASAKLKPIDRKMSTAPKTGRAHS